jgi:hypothetical protein
MFASAYRKLTADQLVNEGPTLVTGYNLNVSTDGGDVTLYDGMDTDSGSKVITLNGLAATNDHEQFSFPVLYNNGLYVDIGANVTEFTIYYIPLRGNSPLKAYPGFMMSDRAE